METPEFSFRIVQILGTGAYGTVVVAQPVDEDRLVVIKVLQPDLSGQQDILARSRDEARLLERISHPNIVAVEGLTQYRGRPVVLMEYVDGVDLGTLMRLAPSGLPAAETLEMIRQVAGALAAAWRTHRVVHRDIKPSNILLSREGQVKVVDFGLAYAEFEDREAHTDVQILGSMGFMAPERSDGLPPSPGMDVYALGITLVQLLTGRNLLLPRAGHRHDKHLDRQLAHLAPKGVEGAALVALRDLIREMCAFDPKARPSASKVEQRLVHIVTHAGSHDLAAFAADGVARARSASPAIKPMNHSDWRHVAFLDEGSREGAPPELLGEPRLEPLSRDKTGPIEALLRMLGLSGR